MRMKHFLFSMVAFFVLLAGAFSPSYAAPLSNIPLTVTQPDGSKIDLFASGDEYFNYYHDADGNVIIQANDGYYTYATLDDNQYAVPSRNYVKKKGFATRYGALKIKANQVKIPKENFQAFDEPETLKSKATRTTNNPKSIANLVVLIRFADDPEFTEDDFNKIKFSYDEVRNYFKEISYQTSDVPSYVIKLNDNTYSYQDAQPRSYYQPYNETINTNGYSIIDINAVSDINSRVYREHTLLKKAIDAIAESVPSTVDLDLDNNNLIDNVSFVVQGATTAWNSLLWPHKWSLYAHNVQLNGKKVYSYNFLLMDSFSAKVNAHELGHSFGAPDYYRYSDQSKPIGHWDMMSYGHAWAHMSLQTKYKYGNWIDEIADIQESGSYGLNPITQPTANGFRLAIPDHPNQHFLIEYRDKTDSVGEFEMGIPATANNGALVIYHVSPNLSGNSYGPPDELALVQADTVGSEFGRNASTKLTLYKTDPTDWASELDKINFDDVQIKFVSKTSKGQDGSSKAEIGVNFAHEVKAAANNASWGDVDISSSDATFASDGKSLKDSNITLKATPRTGYLFERWEISQGDVAFNATQAEVLFAMPDAALSVQAIFKAEETATYLLTLAVEPEQGGSIMGMQAGEYAEEAVIQVNAVANDGYVFDHWEVSGAQLPNTTQANLSFNMVASVVALKAVFKEISTYTVSFNVTPAESGKIKNNKTNVFVESISMQLSSTPEANTVNVSAEPNTGYRFVRWEHNEAELISSDDEPLISFTMPARNFTLTAVFEREPTYDLRLNLDPITGGSITSSVAGNSFTEGTQITVQAIAEDGYHFVRWEMSGITFAVPTNPEQSFAMPANSVVLTAKFEKNAEVPGTPTHPTVSVGDGELTVTWQAPENDGGSLITRYEVTIQPNVSNACEVLSNQEYRCVFSDLINGETYYFDITAFNEIGKCNTPAKASGVPAAVSVKPEAPRNLNVNPGDTQVTVSWDEPENHGTEPITHYTVTTDPDGASCVANAPELNCTVTDLVNGTTYTFSVVATSDAGDSDAATISGTPVQASTKPSAPINPIATPDDGKVMVAWTVPESNGGSLITGYKVTAQPADDAFCETDAETFSCWVENLTNGTEYTFSVVAINEIDKSEPATVKATPKAKATVPTAPTQVKVVAGDAQVTVVWQKPESDGGSLIIGYKVTAQPGSAACNVDAETFSCLLTSLTNGTEYTLSVMAINNIGESEPATVKATPVNVPGAPTNPNAVAGNGEVVVSWITPASNGGSPITGYKVITQPGGATCTTTGLLTCTVTGLTNGTYYKFSIVATNVVGDSPAAVTKSVKPEMTGDLQLNNPTTAITVKRGRKLTLDVNNSFKGAGLAYTVMPIFSSSGNGKFTWTPSATGIYTFTVKATNSTGQSNSYTLTITVNK